MWHPHNQRGHHTAPASFEPATLRSAPAGVRAGRRGGARRGRATRARCGSWGHAHCPAPPLSQVSRGNTPGSAPRARPRAPRIPTRAQPRELRGVLTCEKKRVYPCRIGSCSRRRNRTVPSFRSSITSLLPPQQAVEAVTSVAALCFDTLASSVALANNLTDEGLTRESLMCPFCCLH